MTVYRNYINGRWTEPRSGRYVDNVNPATGEVLGRAAVGTEEDVAEAVAAAKAAFARWRKVPAPRRAEILYRVGELLRERKEELARKMTQEMGKVLPEARGDVQEGIDMAYYMAGEGRRLLGYTTPAEMPDKFAMAVREPIGVVAAITPWNFPMAIPTWKIMPALVAGNTVVFKPATDTPWMAYELVRIFEEAGLPPGVLNLVYGPGETVGEALLRHPDVHLISFTGSVESGRHVNQVAGAQLKRVHLELGGKNAVIVMDDADLDLVEQAVTWSAFGTTGQRCTATSRLLVHEAVYDQVVERLAARAAKLRLGNGLDPQTDVGPLINGRALEKVAYYVDVGQEEGARLVVGGRPATEGELARGFFFQPTIFADVTPDMRIANEEIFGPVLAIIKVRSLEEAIAINNGVQYGLSSAIFTRDVRNAFVAMRDLATGICYVNHGTIGAEIHLPFGGMRATGNGHREAGLAALEVYTEWKAIYVDFSGRLQRAQIDEVKIEDIG
ncbi:aldehyde dehydrogenase family protein [Thermaerobacter composti]|uniref:Aldehyde dehydrogenase family protein n=1 Tax=Thermaerobacter composti TaxID=554949 RepID=A0ABZ0QRE7_9FIRM|nr:aldehyde dehydrogenase family protein [Thermaerobacter composti]PZN01943.1 MAG: aldehyde dehydrogenase [Bacillota bacterium]WPD20068.1 aldehyde dehydrogenase family protein [Thermaerobacter composti]